MEVVALVMAYMFNPGGAPTAAVNEIAAVPLLALGQTHPMLGIVNEPGGEATRVYLIESWHP